MAGYDLHRELKRMECHFNWQLDCSTSSTLKKLQQNLEDRLRCGCSWMRHLYNDLGYLLHAQGLEDEALEVLIKGQKYIKTETEDHEDCSLLINQANMAWVYYHKGELEKSRACLEEVRRLQQEFLTPKGSQVHPVLSAQKGWTLMKFENSHKRCAIECFKMALAGDPEKKNFHKGLALAMEKSYTEDDFKANPGLQREMIDQLKFARDKYENEDVCLGALYLMSLLACGNGCGEALEEANKLADKLIASGEISGLSNLSSLYTYHLKNYDKAISVTEEMQEKFPQSTRVTKNLASCLKFKVRSLPEGSMERKALVKRASDLYKDVGTPYSVKGGKMLIWIHKCAGNSDAVDQVYRQLLQLELTDAEKQGVSRRYRDFKSTRSTAQSHPHGKK